MNLDIKHFYFGLFLVGLFNFSSCKKDNEVDLQLCSDQITAASITIDNEADFNKYHYLEKGDAIYSTEMIGSNITGELIEYILHVELKEICNAEKAAISVRFNAKRDNFEGNIMAILEDLSSQTNPKILELTRDKLEWRYVDNYAFSTNLGIVPGHLRISLIYFFKSNGSPFADDALFYSYMLGMTISLAGFKAE